MLIAANWKMNLDKNSIKSFIEQLRSYKFSDDIKVCIFPPIIYVNFLYELIKNTPILIGGHALQIENPPKFEGDVIGDTSLEDIPKIIRKLPLTN